MIRLALLLLLAIGGCAEPPPPVAGGTPAATPSGDPLQRAYQRAVSPAP